MRAAHVYLARACPGRKCARPLAPNFPLPRAADLAQHRSLLRPRPRHAHQSRRSSQSGLPPPYAASKPLEIAELDLSSPGRGEVLVQIKAAGLCHSDLSVIDGSRPRPMPMALGHEAAGIVETVGEGVTDLKAGDHVVLVFVPSCGRCGPCAAGRPALCEPGAKANAAGTLLSGERRLAFRAEPINHLLGVSAFATHAVVARKSCVKIDPDLPLELAALFGCAVLTGVGAVVNTAKVEPGQSVAVVGLGGVGLSVVLGAGSPARARSSPSISRTTSSPSRRSSARPTRSTPARTTPSAKSDASPATASTSPWRWPARFRRSSSPMRRPPAAA